MPGKLTPMPKRVPGSPEALSTALRTSYTMVVMPLSTLLPFRLKSTALV